MILSKFPSRMVESWYAESLETGCDDQWSAAGRWVGRMGTIVLAEDEQGFVSGHQYKTLTDAEVAFGASKY